MPTREAKDPLRDTTELARQQIFPDRVSCPTCGAPEGKFCVGMYDEGAAVSWHESRKRRAERVRSGF